MAKSVKPKPSARRGTPGGKRSQAELVGITNAINRSQAVIEFELDGTVITANENFCRALGYTLEEIKGKHHSLFVEPTYRDSGEYREFWSRLARGEFDAGQYKRIGKDGREVWIQASYNPVLDAKGKPFRVIKFAADITAGKLKEADFSGQLAALGKAMAVIEFKLDGTVLTANDNFCRTLGYTLEEIKGKHHSLFVDPAYRDSAEYRQFWERLGRGEYDAGQYKRIGKGGREVWLEASYNPILDMSGRPFKVVKFASNVTQQKAEARMNAAFKGALDNVSANLMVADMDFNIIYLNNIMREMMAAVQGDFRRDLPNFDASRLLGTSIDVFHKNPTHQRAMLAGLTKTHTAVVTIGGRTMRLTVNPMLDEAGRRLGTVVEWLDRTQEIAVEQEVQSIVEEIIAGKLERRASLDGKTGFYQKIASGINQVTDNMADVVRKVKEAATEVSRGADEISQGNTNLSQRTEEQASSLEETASSMEQMTSTVRQNADNAGQANQLAVAARDQAETGGAVVARAVGAMKEINDSSKKIADIISVIDEIAFQTNLLALNAAVEAARAGEQGRGFAVVASEVRNLAGRSATAAKEIKELIQDSVRKVEEGSSLVTQSGQTLEHIVASVKKVSDIVAEIAAASQEQSTGIEQVNKAVMQLDELTQQNAALVEQASAASQAMADQSRALNEMMLRYDVSGSAPAAAPAAGAPAPARFAAPAAPRKPQAAAPAERRAPTRPWSSPSGRPAPAQPAPRRAAGAAASQPAAASGTDQEWKEF